MSGTCKAAEQAEEFVKKVWAAGWRVVHHRSLPDWLQDNDFLHTGHRPPTNSFLVCFKSIFRIHTETGNIWSHLLGMTLLQYTYIYIIDLKVRENDINFLMISSNKSVLTTKLQYTGRSLYITHDVLKKKFAEYFFVQNLHRSIVVYI